MENELNCHQETNDDVHIDLTEETGLEYTFDIHAKVDSNKEPEFIIVATSTTNFSNHHTTFSCTSRSLHNHHQG